MVLGGAGAKPTSVKVVKVVKAATSLSSDTLDVGTDWLSSCSGQFDDPVAGPSIEEILQYNEGSDRCQF